MTDCLRFLEENIADFVAKKREMFLVQMSLDVKKAEILKLDARAKDKEEAYGKMRPAFLRSAVQLRCQALNKSKQMLDKDVERFDAFLSRCPRTLQFTALRRAERRSEATTTIGPMMPCRRPIKWPRTSKIESSGTFAKSVPCSSCSACGALDA